MQALSTAIAACCVASAAAQCERPEVPLGGFPTTEHPAELVTYGDGAATRGALIAPTIAPPPCGWPLVVYVHNLGTSRLHQHDWQRELAGFGFAVWAYDIRGQGESRVLGTRAGTTLYGGTERFDLAEQISFVRSRYPSIVSQRSVGVTGDSQGGVHGWFAAAQSGRPISMPGRGSILFPEIGAVAAADFVTDPVRHRLRGGTLFASNFVELVLLDDSVAPFQLDRSFHDLVVQYFLAQDPRGLARALGGEPHRAIEPLIAETRVPTLFFHGWQDSICGPGPILDASRSWPAQTPLRLVFGAIGHASPRNVYQLGMRHVLTRRWFERFLWQESNGVDDEARFVLAKMPLEPRAHADPASLWSHELTDTFPPPDAVFTRYYTTAGGRLVDAATPAGRSSVIEHRVAPGYDAPAYVTNPANRGVAGVLRGIPLSEATFQLAAFASETVVAGVPRVSLEVVPDAGDFTIAAVLFARLPSGERRMLSAWGSGVLDALVGARMRVDIELSPILAALPAGTVLELSLRNHWLLEEPHLTSIATVPMFTSSMVRIEHGPSFVEIPLRADPIPALVTPALRIDPNAPGRTPFELRGGAGRAAEPYIVLATLSGHTPGIRLRGGVVPIRFDALTQMFASIIGGSELVDFFGVLDAGGTARPVLDLTSLGAVPALLGRRMTLAAWVYESTTDITGAPTNPVDLALR